MSKIIFLLEKSIKLFLIKRKYTKDRHISSEQFIYNCKQLWVNSPYSFDYGSKWPLAGTVKKYMRGMLKWGKTNLRVLLFRYY
jgi:hypothetical protein